GGRRAVAPLTKRLYDAVWRVRQAAALALGNLGDPRALPVLEQVLGTVREPDVDVREAAQQAIAQIQAGIR
ncbi:HEAT repeat domain-containing protein, partial [Candidatus Acetothermia bacterium]|nr:HEAT repeat domain-containing protein [Candidatus Acetothermia bacterium]